MSQGKATLLPSLFPALLDLASIQQSIKPLLSLYLWSLADEALQSLIWEELFIFQK